MRSRLLHAHRGPSQLRMLRCAMPWCRCPSQRAFAVPLLAVDRSAPNCHDAFAGRYWLPHSEVRTAHWRANSLARLLSVLPRSPLALFGTVRGVCGFPCAVAAAATSLSPSLQRDLQSSDALLRPDSWLMRPLLRFSVLLRVSLGKRRYDRKQAGYGGQTKPVFHKKAKTTKKVVLKLKCSKCSQSHQVVLKRCKHFEVRTLAHTHHTLPTANATRAPACSSYLQALPVCCTLLTSPLPSLLCFAVQLGGAKKE